MATTKKKVVDTTKEEVKEVTVETTPIVEEVVEVKEEVKDPEVVEQVIEQPKVAEVPKAATTNEPELSIEERILNFIDSRTNGSFRLNDFLKSLYGVPKFPNPQNGIIKGKARN
jgi:predicted deacylase